MPDAYAGEVPVCYVSLLPNPTATEEELTEHAHSTIGERPAWAASNPRRRRHPADSEGGPRGLHVDVVLPEALSNRRGDVERTLSAYLFEATVDIG